MIQSLNKKYNKDIPGPEPESSTVLNQRLILLCHVKVDQTEPLKPAGGCAPTGPVAEPGSVSMLTAFN